MPKPENTGFVVSSSRPVFSVFENIQVTEESLLFYTTVRRRARTKGTPFSFECIYFQSDLHLYANKLTAK